jgi:hypothetical protein
MARKTKIAELKEYHDKNNTYGYAVHFPNYTIRYAVLAITEKEAQEKVKELHPGQPITYLFLANRIIL